MKIFEATRIYFATAMIGILLVGVVWGGHAAMKYSGAETSQASADRKVRLVAAQALPRMEGERLKATLVEVTYAPGAFSPAHSHPCPVIGYVVSGQLRSQVNGDPEVIYKPGESFYEPSNGAHLVSANASQAEPAKLLALFICDREVELSTPLSSKQTKDKAGQ